MNEQELKQEAERKYPLHSHSYEIEVQQNFIIELTREAYIAGALSRSGGVWVKVDYNNLPPEKFNPYFVKMCDNGIPGTLWPSDFKKCEAVYYLDESSAADKGDAIEQSDNNSYWLKKLVKKTDEIKELKEGFITSLRVLKTMCEKAGLEMGTNKAQELIDGLETKIDVKDILRTQIPTNAPDLSNPSKNLLH